MKKNSNCVEKEFVGLKFQFIFREEKENSFASKNSNEKNRENSWIIFINKVDENRLD